MASTWPLLALKAFATVGKRWWQKHNPATTRRRPRDFDFVNLILVLQEVLPMLDAK